MSIVHDAIVVGSGFGGAVAAARLAQAGRKTLVLERGRRYDVNRFPRNWNDVADGWMWEVKQGLFDVKLLSQMTIVQSAGLGGGSLIYANVHLRAPEAVFAERWPAGYSRALLDPYYDLVAYMLDINPITASGFLGMPPKTVLMKKMAEAMGRGAEFCYPNIAVDFSQPDVAHRNKFGAEQRGCNYCGECDIGCNIHAKNTLDFNYLKVASDHGAEIRTQCEAIKIEPAGGGYRVWFRDYSAGAVDSSAEAKAVFLCAGAVNSTELLLRCRDEFGTLPRLSARLGCNYSGNGDFLAFAFNTGEPFMPSRGPTITTGIVYDRKDGDANNWFIFEEGGYPKEIGAALQILNPKSGLLKRIEIAARQGLEMLLREAGEKAGTAAPEADRSAVFLAMGRDKADGRIYLDPVTRRLEVRWNLTNNLPLYDAETRFSNDLAQQMGGEAAFNPLWRSLKTPVSVHNLGGCPMADTPADGVINGHGEAFNYPGLFVLDGACVPVAIGANPSHTIAAVAERNIETAIRRMIGNASWEAPEKSAARRIDDPLSAIRVGGSPPTKTRMVGVAFTETMKGFVSTGWNPADDYAGAERAGQNADRRMNFTLTITLSDLDSFLAGDQRSGVAVGRLSVDGLTPTEGVPVSNGLFNLFVSGDQPDRRRMLYALPFTGIDNHPYLLDGFKDVRDHGHFDVWDSTSTLYTVIRSGSGRDGAVVATGILRIHIADFLKQLTTFQIPGASSEAERIKTLGRFGDFFFGSLWEVFVKPHIPGI